MNRGDFINMMSEHGPLNRQSIGEVYELVDIFPYFQSAHLLLLKGLHNNDDVKFESQLRNSAIHIADREVLYYLLTKKPEQVELKVDIEEVKTLNNEQFSGTEQTVIESAKNSLELITEFERISGLADSEEEQDDEEEKVFYMDPGFAFPEEEEDLLELDLDENKSYDDFDTAIESELQSEEEGASKKKFQADLIDKFIITNPRIEPNREKTNLPVEDISKSYVEEKGGFVTETLARIYISQGYYSKAIDIYEELSLKFPEKSSYFASQIEKVKEYIKN